MRLALYVHCSSEEGEGREAERGKCVPAVEPTFSCQRAEVTKVATNFLCM